MCAMSPPIPAPLPPAPSRDEAANLAAVQAEKQKAINAAGLSSTIITGGLGASDFDTAGKKKTGTTVLGQTA